jgi:hypothetical protein
MSLNKKMSFLTFFSALFFLLTSLNLATAQRSLNITVTPLENIITTRADIAFLSYAVTFQKFSDLYTPFEFDLALSPCHITKSHHSDPTTIPGVILSLHPDWNPKSKSGPIFAKQTPNHHIIPLIYSVNSTNTWLSTPTLQINNGFGELFKSDRRFDLGESNTVFFTVTIPLNSIFVTSWPVKADIKLSFKNKNGDQSVINVGNVEIRNVEINNIEQNIVNNESSDGNNNNLEQDFEQIIDELIQNEQKNNTNVNFDDNFDIFPHPLPHSSISSSLISSSDQSPVYSFSNQDDKITHSASISPLDPVFTGYRPLSLFGSQYKIKFSFNRILYDRDAKVQIDIYSGYFSTLALFETDYYANCEGVKYYEFCETRQEWDSHSQRYIDRRYCEQRRKVDTAWKFNVFYTSPFHWSISGSRSDYSFDKTTTLFECNGVFKTTDPIIIDWRLPEAEKLNFSTFYINPFAIPNRPVPDFDTAESIKDILNTDWTKMRKETHTKAMFPSSRSYKMTTLLSPQTLLAFNEEKDDFYTQAEVNSHALAIGLSIMFFFVLSAIIFVVVSMWRNRTSTTYHAVGPSPTPVVFITPHTPAPVGPGNPYNAPAPQYTQGPLYQQGPQYGNGNPYTQNQYGQTHETYGYQPPQVVGKSIH